MLKSAGKKNKDTALAQTQTGSWYIAPCFEKVSKQNLIKKIVDNPVELLLE